MSKPSILATEARAGSGSRVARRERRTGRVPVNIYGHGQPNAALTVDSHDLDLALHTTAQVFTLSIGGKQESCLVRDVQFDTYGQRVLHVDFTRIDLSEEVQVEVHLVFRGQPKGVDDGGTQVVHHPALAVRCRADQIPDEIVVDVSEIEIGHALHAGEISLPPGVKLDDKHVDPEDPVVGVVVRKVEVEPEPEEAAVEGEGAEEGAEGAAEGEKPAEGGKPDDES